MVYERISDRLLTRAEFAWRVVRHALYATLAVALTLLTGILGYHYLGHLGWIDALLNASMILGGMGPVSPMSSDAEKVFASFYALFSGLFFIALLGILLAPFIHRIIHRFHIEDSDD
ncbi:MAG TPA: hypothetical protein VMU84_22055 [Thermoanaerobaculia bacterium]|nr:hypothetical protein [Thermoanaerobaculia bacterium]